MNQVERYESTQARHLAAWVAEHRTEEEQVDRMEGIMDFVGYRILVPLAVALVFAVIVVQIAIKVGCM